MKKLLVLMLVLGMASMANATLSLNVSSTEPVATIDGLIESETTIYLFIASDAPIVITKGGAAPSLAGYGDTVAAYRGYGVPIPSEYTYGEGWIMGAPAGEAYVTGTYLIGTGAAGDNVMGGWFDEVGGYGEIDYRGTLVVPEPATIALLGLGGLLLCRRKK